MTSLLSACTDPSVDVVLVDVDNDGDLDALFAIYLARNRLYIWDKKQGRYIDQTLYFLPSDPSGTNWCRNLKVMDIDLNGDKDIFCIQTSSYFYINNQN